MSHSRAILTPFQGAQKPGSHRQGVAQCANGRPCITNGLEESGRRTFVMSEVENALRSGHVCRRRCYMTAAKACEGATCPGDRTRCGRWTREKLQCSQSRVLRPQRSPSKLGPGKGLAPWDCVLLVGFVRRVATWDGGLRRGEVTWGASTPKHSMLVAVHNLQVLRRCVVELRYTHREAIRLQRHRSLPEP